MDDPPAVVAPSIDAKPSNPPPNKIKSEDAVGDSARGRQISEAPSSRARDEASQERADRKRQELKRELGESESTSAASKNVGVVKKKKRKF
jgi:hypothetical protein